MSTGVRPQPFAVVVIVVLLLGLLGPTTVDGASDGHSPRAIPPTTTASVQGRLEYSAAVVPERPSVNDGGVLHLSLVPLRQPQALSSCAVLLPSGQRVILASNTTTTTTSKAAGVEYDDAEHAQHSLAGGWCGVRVQDVLQELHEGRWVLEAKDRTTGVVDRGMAVVNVYGTEMLVTPPAVQAEKGETVVLRLRPATAATSKETTTSSWQGCQAVRPDGAVVQVTGIGAAKTNVTSDASVRAAEAADNEDLCAVAIGPLEARHAGKWQLQVLRQVKQAEKELSVVRRASATVGVKGPYVHADDAPAVSAVMGSRGVELRCGPAEAVSCRLHDPSGEAVAFKHGPCRHVVDRVRAKHAGTWTCSALLPGYLHAVNDTTTLTLAVPLHTETAVVRAADDAGAVLQCRLAGVGARDMRPSYCRWDSPRGEPLLLREGVAASAYGYAGRGLAAGDCSMRIASLRPEDFGVWRCVIGFDKARSRGGIVVLAKDRASRAGAADVAVVGSPMRSPESGLVRRGAALTVGCRAPRALSYCWLRSPAGDLFVVDEAWTADGMRYGGDGLELGECAVRVQSAAADKHSGTWRCGMGLAGAREPTFDLEVTIDVTVTDALVLPEQTNVTAPEGGRALLACRTALAEAVRYCRFQRPDGSSLHLADDEDDVDVVNANAASSRYRYAGRGLRVGSCGLAVDNVAVEDFGFWTCGMALAGDVLGAEQTAPVLLLREDEDGVAEAAMVGACVLLLVLASTVGGTLVYRRVWVAPRRPPHRRASDASSSMLHAIDMNVVWTDSSPSSTRRPRTRSATTRMASTRLSARTTTRRQTTPRGGRRAARGTGTATTPSPEPVVMMGRPSSSPSSSSPEDVPESSRKIQ